MKRVVLDTNIFISALFWKGKPRLVLDACINRQVQLLISIDILNELERKLSSKKFASELFEAGLAVNPLLGLIQQWAENVLPAAVPEESVRDSNDVMIIACAVGGQADYIISGDKDLTTLGLYAGIPIVTPAQFLSLL